MTTEYNAQILIILRDDDAVIDPGDGKSAQRLTVAGMLSFQITQKEKDLNAWSVAPTWVSSTKDDVKYRIMNASVRQQDIQQMPTFLSIVCQDSDTVNSDANKILAYDAQGELIGGYVIIKNDEEIFYSDARQVLLEFNLEPFSGSIP